jgi:hypothetical protein
MKKNLFSALIILIIPMTTITVNAQYSIKAVTIHGTFVEYTLIVGKRNFRCDPKGVAHLNAKEVNSLKNEDVSFYVKNDLARKSFDPLFMYAQDPADKTGKKLKILSVFGLTLQKLIASKYTILYFQQGFYNFEQFSLPSTPTG